VPEWYDFTPCLFSFRSGSLKKEYDRLKEEMVKAEEDTQFTYQKKKTLGLERKEAKMEKEEAEKYKKLQDNLTDRQVSIIRNKIFKRSKILILSC